MCERGIHFNSEMVRAVMEGRKVQTRRIMKVQPESHQFGLLRITDSTKRGDIGKYHWAESNATGVHTRSALFSCPFGAVGDRLWVRETWADVNHEGCPAVAYRADGEVRDLNEDEGEEDDPNLEKYWFANWYPDLINGTEGRWTPSIHMPRWASRITLEITGVRVERLNSMTESDALAEGCNGGHDSIPGYMYSATPHEHFHHVWQSIYGADSWQANPWVWVIEFKRVANHTIGSSISSTSSEP
ncbi:hypothetical protein ACIP6T_09910 [Pantoea sp. NPDC088449]|uniref:hypothetical protein n=1 Tax=Pantoea sp. NPDC088449 TaxID=3364392 RepID=UPI0038070F94